MPYVQPGAFAQLFPGGPALGFPLGGYVGDVFGDDPTVFHLIVYTPSAVTGDARQVGVLYLPDPARWPQPIPKQGWPLLSVNSGAGQGTWPPRLNVVPDDPTSNLAYEALEHGWAVWWTSIAGPALGYPSSALGHGTEDLVVRTGQGLLPDEYEHCDGPGSPTLQRGAEYLHDRFLTYRKQGQWQVQFARGMGATGQWPINPKLIASAGISWGGDVAVAQHAMPELADPALADFRRYSSRTQLAAALAPPFWLPALVAGEGNVYGYQLPHAAAPLTDDCHASGWAAAPAPSGWSYAHELSLERLAFGRYAEAVGVGERWPGAPTHAALIAQTQTLRLFIAGANQPFHYGASTPTEFCAMAGAGHLRTFTDSGKLTCAVAGGVHSPAWQVQMAQRFFELDGSTDPGGFQRQHSRFVLPAAVLDLLAGHTTTGDPDAPYGPVPLQELPWLVKEDVEEAVGGATEAEFGYLGKRFAAWLEAEAHDIDPSFRKPAPTPVL
ncbi:MAG TPA: hypothetical protein VJP77_09255, partial [Planctomycetota bacterium]|nr:hypothetical protein [Planctomycetota bacterium]